jgi:hypothetical protein
LLKLGRGGVVHMWLLAGYGELEVKS